MSRRDNLLTIAAVYLAAGEDPFAGDFSAEHDVTLDEQLTLAEDLAVAARMLVTVRDWLSSPAVEDLPNVAELARWLVASSAEAALT